MQSALSRLLKAYIARAEPDTLSQEQLLALATEGVPGLEAALVGEMVDLVEKGGSAALPEWGFNTDMTTTTTTSGGPSPRGIMKGATFGGNGGRSASPAAAANQTVPILPMIDIQTLSNSSAQYNGGLSGSGSGSQSARGPPRTAPHNLAPVPPREPPLSARGRNPNRGPPPDWRSMPIVGPAPKASYPRPDPNLVSELELGPPTASPGLLGASVLTPMAPYPGRPLPSNGITSVSVKPAAADALTTNRMRRIAAAEQARLDKLYEVGGVGISPMPDLRAELAQRLSSLQKTVEGINTRSRRRLNTM